LLKAHVVNLALAAHFRLEPFGDGVHAFGPDPVETAGNDVGTLAELPAGMEIGQNKLERGDVVSRMDIDRDAAAVVFDGTGAGEVDRDRDLGAMSGEGLVDRVVDDLVDAVMKAALSGIADVHVGPLPDALQPLQLLDFRGIVFG